MSKSYYLTTPIYYVNDKPHIGHAYTTLACDALARFKRLDGFDVMFLTGTDEHGQKVQKSAEDKGIDPKTFTDQVSQNFRDLTATLNFTNDDFIRTTEERHYKSCQKLWNTLIENGDIYLGSYAGWYAVRDEAFYAESEITDGKAPSGAPVEWVEEPSYFFRLSAYQDKLLAHYDANPDFVAPKSRLNEVRSFVAGGLNDLSVSRASFSWGVPVPGDDAHVMYVWLDALTNYITAAGYGQDDEADRFPSRWPADLHMVGKDIVRFHAVYWPAFLMAAGVPLPKRVYAHGWWTNEGQKISKSLGNVIDPVDIAETYGLDQMRYFLLREVPFGNDGDFSHNAMVHRMNGDLANDLGNLSQRVLSMIFKNCDGVMPSKPTALAEADETILKQVDGLLERQRDHYDNQQFHEALKDIWDVVSAANRYVDDMAPWALRKTDLDRMGDVLWVLAETLRQVAILIQPVMPEASAAMLDQLVVPDDARGFDQLGQGSHMQGGQAIDKPVPIFPRYVEEESA
jgi:methionyl-tRNA synthetase